jgi:glycosyltransferase involved in cell wall biosynthesis
LPGAAIIAVDDGSADETYLVASRAADMAVRFEKNLGKGAALRTGFDLAIDRGAESIVTIDADGQHDPRLAPDLVRALGDADVAIGARQRSGGRMPAGRRLTNSMSAAAVAHCIGRRVDDAQSGFRAMTRRVVGDVRPRGNRYEFETEFLIMAGRRGFRLTFVPIPTVYDSVVPSQFRPVRDSARIIGTLWRFGLGAGR